MSFFEFLWDEETRAKWFQQMQAELNLDVIPRPVLTAHKMVSYMQVSREQIEEHQDWLAGIAANRARRAAMTPEQRAAEDAEWEARRAREKAERTCEHCGCDPDEHGDC